MTEYESRAVEVVISLKLKGGISQLPQNDVLIVSEKEATNPSRSSSTSPIDRYGDG